MSSGELATIASIVGIAVGLIGVYEFLVKRETPAEGRLLEVATGSYVLGAWTPAVNWLYGDRGFELVGGALVIEPSGVMRWAVNYQSHAPVPGRVRVTARAQLQLNGRRVIGIPGAHNGEHFLDGSAGRDGIGTDARLAVRGWDVGREDEFTLELTRSRTGLLIQMSNSRGTFTWLKAVSTVEPIIGT